MQIQRLNLEAKVAEALEHGVIRHNRLRALLKGADMGAAVFVPLPLLAANDLAIWDESIGHLDQPVESGQFYRDVMSQAVEALVALRIPGVERHRSVLEAGHMIVLLACDDSVGMGAMVEQAKAEAERETQPAAAATPEPHTEVA